MSSAPSSGKSLRISYRAALACLPLMLATGCARTLFGNGEPLQPWATPADQVAVETRDDVVVFRPSSLSVASPQVVLFLHGFASRPEQYNFTLQQLAARGFVVVAPVLPDYFVFRIGYHGSVLKAAQAAYDLALEEANRLHAPRPRILGYSMGGGAALLVGADRKVPTALWAPVPLDFAVPAPTAPLLVIAADHDCIAKEKPQKLIETFGTAAESVVIPGNHLGFTDMSGGESYDCPSPVSRSQQREDAVNRVVAFFAAHTEEVSR